MLESANKIESLFSAALAQEAGQDRDRWLTEHCGSDVGLRRRLESLLRCHDQAGTFLEEPATTWIDGELGDLNLSDVSDMSRNTLDASEANARLKNVAGASEESGGAAQRDTITDLQSKAVLRRTAYLFAISDNPAALGRLGDYEILKLIGAGGMGIVFLAVERKLNRRVAIKIMEPSLAGDHLAALRFMREAQATAAISHDHVVAIHAVETEHDPPYIVMPYLAGGSLQNRLDNGPLDLSDIISIGTQVASGLAAAHDQGLIHRDVKPANILLERTSLGHSHAKLTDFGLARAADDGRLTLSGKINGTPHFMSPEQAQDADVDARSDLFSLGCVLYAMSTGASPFQMTSTLASLRAVCDVPHRPLHAVNSAVPVWLSELVDQLLEKDPQRRPASAHEVAARLRDSSRHQLPLKLAPASSDSAQADLGVARAPDDDEPVTHMRRTWRLAALACTLLAIAAAFMIWRPNDGEHVLTTDRPEIAVDLTEHSGIGVLDEPTASPSVELAQHPLLAADWEWTEPENLGAPVNSAADESQPFLSADGLSLIFDSIRADGYGGTDLWECQRPSVHDAWGPARNLGPIVNSARHDGNAWLSPNRLTLYFASIRSNGVGDYDLWMSQRPTVNSEWATPVNLGANVNSPNLDGGPSLTPDELTIWFHSYRSPIEGSDIWTAQRASRDEAFGIATNLGPPVNVENSLGESSCAISPDQRCLLWTLCIGDNPAMFELWMAVRGDAREPFTHAQPLSRQLNDGSATCPCWASDGQSVIFDASRPGGQGGRDLWIVRRQKK